MNIRQFKLISGNSELDLNVKGGTFMSTPSGLGYAVNNTFTNIGNSYALAKSVPKQGEISCEMVFADYSQYVTFIRFCSGASNLIFAYRYPVSNGYLAWYYREVTLASCEKGEIGEGNVLHCSTKWACRSNWYTETTYNTPTSGNGQIYFTVLNHGDVDAGYRLRLKGNGNVVTGLWIAAGFDTFSTSTYPFGFSATDSDYYYHLITIDTHARMYRENPLLDPVDTVEIVPDYKQDIFCKLPKTSENITLGITYTGTATFNASLTVREEYISV